MKVKIGDDLIGKGEPCYIIAEAGANHKINCRHRLTQINTDKMKRAMPLKIWQPTQQKKKKSVSQIEGGYTLYTTTK